MVLLDGGVYGHAVYQIASTLLFALFNIIRDQHSASVDACFRRRLCRDTSGPLDFIEINTII